MTDDQHKQDVKEGVNTFKNGKIYDGDKVIGTYKDLGPDLPGDLEANRQAASMIVNTFDSTMKEFGKNAAYAATGTLALRGIGAGLEALQAARTARTAITEVTTARAPLTSHALIRAAQRGISQAMVDEAVTSAEQTGAISSRVGQYGTIQHTYHGTNGISVVVETERRNAGQAITVYRTGSKP